MNKLIFLFILVPFTVLSQTGRIEIGYQNAFNYSREFSSMVDRYNTSRPWLENELKLPNVHNGISFGIYSDMNRFSIGLAMSYVWYSAKTSGADKSNQSFERKIRSHIFTFELFDMSYDLIHTNKIRFGFGLVPFDMSRGRISTRLDENDWKYATKIGWFSDYKKAHWFAGLKLQTHLGYQISEKILAKFTFFYQLNYTGKMNLLFVDESLNPRTYGAYYTSHNFKNPSYFGMRISLNILTD